MHVNRVAVDAARLHVFGCSAVEIEAARREPVGLQLAAGQGRLSTMRDWAAWGCTPTPPKWHRVLSVWAYMSLPRRDCTDFKFLKNILQIALHSAYVPPQPQQRGQKNQQQGPVEMFTIKHVSPTGNETLYQATEASFVSDPSGATSFVNYTAPNSNEIKSIEGGTVYVMNEAGKTVATYRMESATEANYAKQYSPATDRAMADAQDEFNRRVSDQPHYLKPDGRIG